MTIEWKKFSYGPFAYYTLSLTITETELKGNRAIPAADLLDTGRPMIQAGLRSQDSHIWR